MLQVLLHVVKASYAKMISCGKLIQKAGEFKEILTPVIDSLTLLGTSTREINQFRRNLIKHNLPANLKPLAKDVPSGSDLLFWDKINKRTSQLSATNSALQRPGNQAYSSNNKYDHKSGKQTHCRSSRNFRVPRPPYHTEALHRGTRATTGNNYRKRYMYVGFIGWEIYKTFGIMEENNIWQSHY